MDNKMIFIDNNHEKNYLSLRNEFSGQINKDFDMMLRLITMEEVYYVAKEYIKGINIGFKELLKDSRISNTGRFISELAYSFSIRKFAVKSLDTIGKLDMTTRNFIIGLLYEYEPAC